MNFAVNAEGSDSDGHDQANDQINTSIKKTSVADNTLKMPLLTMSDHPGRSSGRASISMMQTELNPEVLDHQIEKAEFEKMLKSSKLPQIFKSTCQQY